MKTSERLYHTVRVDPSRVREIILRANGTYIIRGRDPKQDCDWEYSNDPGGKNQNESPITGVDVVSRVPAINENKWPGSNEVRKEIESPAIEWPPYHDDY